MAATLWQDRASIVSDAYALVKAGKMGANQLVRLLPAYKGEDNSTVWKALDSVLLGLDKVLKRINDNKREAFWCLVCLVGRLFSLVRLTFEPYVGKALLRLCTPLMCVGGP